MPCLKRGGGPTRAQQSERKAMKNGFRPGVHDDRGGVYVGQWVDDAKQGKGKKLYKNKTIYEGDWVGNKRHGFGVLMKKVDDHFVFVCEGQWINDRFANGKWYGKDGVYDGSLSTMAGVARTKCGHGTMRWNDGAVYQGHWRNNVYNGAGRLLEANGNYYDGQWRNGIKHGEGVYVFCDKGKIMEGVWLSGVPKISVVKHLGVGQKPVSAKHRPLLPKLLKSDKKNIQDAYNNARLEVIEEVQKCI